MATTTVLDFVPVFKRRDPAELMTDLLFRSVECYASCLTLFVCAKQENGMRRED
jgi:hypothetical protein